MKNVLNGSLKFWHLLVVGIALMLFTGATVALADTDAIKGFWLAGTVRFASTFSDDTVTITGTDTPPVKVLSVTITIPEGKKAELQATFSADLHHGVGGAGYAYCFGHFGLDSLNPDPGFKPGGNIVGPPSNSTYQLLGGSQSKQPDAVTVAMAGYRKNVSAGTHIVNVYITSAYSGCTLFARNLNVIANIH